jgi:hypothetical protein
MALKPKSLDVLKEVFSDVVGLIEFYREFSNQFVYFLSSFLSFIQNSYFRTSIR